MLLFIPSFSGSFPSSSHHPCSDIRALTLWVLLPKPALTPTLSRRSCKEIFVFARGGVWVRNGGAGGALHPSSILSPAPGGGCGRLTIYQGGSSASAWRVVVDHGV